MPGETISVSELVGTNLPCGLQSVLRSPESCLSKQTPSWTVEDLWKTHVLPRDWLDSLDVTLDYKWGGGIQSIEAPAGSKDLQFPLWVGNFWLGMAEVIEQRGMWEKARGWMLGMLQGPEIQEAERLMDRTPWGLRLWPLGGHDQSTRVGFLAGLLSNEWLAERHIDTLVMYLNDRFRRGNQPGATLVADVYLGSLLSRKRGGAATKLQEDRELRTYADKILNGNHERLLFPAHVGGSASGHWIVFSVNIKERTVSYGEFSHKADDRAFAQIFVKATPSNPWSQDRT